MVTAAVKDDTNLLAWKSWSTTSGSTSPLLTWAVFWKISVEQAFNLPGRLANRSTSYNGGPPAIRWPATRRSAWVVVHPLLTMAQDQLMHFFGNVQYDLWILSLYLSLLFDAISFLSKSLFSVHAHCRILKGWHRLPSISVDFAKSTDQMKTNFYEYLPSSRFKISEI